MANKSKEVFISYSTKDTDTALALLEMLEAHGLDCWIAPRNIPQGAQWAEEIDKAIQNARVFVVIVSAHSVKSRQVPKEIALAVTACESIFPFRIDDIGLQGTFRYYLSDYQFTDATTDPKQKMKELAEVICTSLGKPIPEIPAETKSVKTEAAASGVEKAVKEKPDGKPLSLKETIESSRKTPKTAVSDAGRKSMKPVLIGVIAAAAVIAVILGVVLSGKNKKDNNAVAAPAVTEAAQSASEVQQDSSPADLAVSGEPDETEEESSRSSSENMDAAESSLSIAADSDAAVSSSQGASSENTSDASVEVPDTSCGVWKKIAYEDRGAETDINTSDLYIFGDEKVSFSAEDWLNGSGSFSLTADQLLNDNEKYDLTVETSIKDTLDESISDKVTGFTSITIAPYMPGSLINADLPQDNPTGLTYSDLYPEQYLYVHLTGTCQESPVKKSDVDTWLVYKKEYPILGKKIRPALTGDWSDDLGNTWTFFIEDEDLSFRMTDSSGITYNGVKYQFLSASESKTNFFEHIQFEFEEYSTDFYAVLCFDGLKLELLDSNWNNYTLTRK